MLNGVGKVNGQGEKDLKPRQSFKTGLSDWQSKSRGRVKRVEFKNCHDKRKSRGCLEDLFNSLLKYLLELPWARALWRCSWICR